MNILKLYLAMGLKLIIHIEELDFLQIYKPTLLASPGKYINSFFYPDELVQQNSNVSQKTIKM